MRGTFRVALTAGLMVFLLAAPALAQDGYAVGPAPTLSTPPGPGVSTEVLGDTASATPGELITVRFVDEEQANSEGIDVDVSARNEVLATGTAAADGSYDVPFTVPGNLAPGCYGVIVEGSVRGILAVFPFCVGAAQQTPAPLAFTGGSSWSTAQLGIGLVAIGGLVVLTARKRRKVSVTVDG